MSSVCWTKEGANTVSLTALPVTLNIHQSVFQENMNTNLAFAHLVCSFYYACRDDVKSVHQNRIPTAQTSRSRHMHHMHAARHGEVHILFRDLVDVSCLRTLCHI